MSVSRGRLKTVSAQFAKGWYVVSWSVDLKPKQAIPLQCLSRHFVLYRSEAGVPTLLDAHCPHLGAHLGHGGRVEGDDIVCPFHAWKFCKSGRCVDVPYAKRIPPKAAVRSYPVKEHSGMILAYFGPEATEPDYDVPPIPELEDPEWTPMQFAEITIATEPREVVENVADSAHFLPVHKQRVNDFEMIIDGPRATQITFGSGRNLRGEKIVVKTTATYHGPAIQFTRLKWAYDMVLINAHIPLDEKTLLLRFGVTLKKEDGVDIPQQVVDMHVAAARDGYFDDVAIWENKRWRDRPVLADGDGPIMKLRQWHQSFYADAF